LFFCFGCYCAGASGRVLRRRGRDRQGNNARQVQIGSYQRRTISTIRVAYIDNIYIIDIRINKNILSLTDLNKSRFFDD